MDEEQTLAIFALYHTVVEKLRLGDREFYFQYVRFLLIFY